MNTLITYPIRNSQGKTVAVFRMKKGSLKQRLVKPHAYKWKMSDTWFGKGNVSHEMCRPKVLSSFSSGGGSSLGYKKAGMDVVANIEFYSKYSDTYRRNFDVKYSYEEMVQNFNKRKNLPQELLELDCLDGSPPCKAFSMNGKRSKGWGKERSYLSGTPKQLIENLFLDFSDLAHKLKPKIVIAENVDGLLKGESKKFVPQIYEAFNKAGYRVSHYVIDSSKYGLPQKRKRFFLVAVREDLVKYIGAAPFKSVEYKIENIELLNTQLPKLKFPEELSPIPFSEIDDKVHHKDLELTGNKLKNWHKCEQGKTFMSVIGSQFNVRKLHPEKPVNTVIPGGSILHHQYPRILSKIELEKASSWPLDYDFGYVKHQEIMGRAVPPIIMAMLAEMVYNQYLVPIYNQSYKVTKESVLKRFKKIRKKCNYSSFPNPTRTVKDKSYYYYHRYCRLGRILESLSQLDNRIHMIDALLDQIDGKVNDQALPIFEKIYHLLG